MKLEEYVFSAVLMELSHQLAAQMAHKLQRQALQPRLQKRQMLRQRYSSPRLRRGVDELLKLLQNAELRPQPLQLQSKTHFARRAQGHGNRRFIQAGNGTCKIIKPNRISAMPPPI